MEELVDIAEFNTVNEAYLLKARLESEGIRVFLQNENMNTLLFGASFASVKLQVRLSDSFRAMDLIYEDPK